MEEEEEKKVLRCKHKRHNLFFFFSFFKLDSTQYELGESNFNFFFHAEFEEAYYTSKYFLLNHFHRAVTGFCVNVEVLERRFH